MLALLVNIFSGIGWEPEIRGLLTVLLAAAVLMGTVWVILVTNTGVRLGSLVALAGFFGWFTIMAFVWWLFGIGYTGDNPNWELKDMVRDPAGIEARGIEEFTNLPDPNCNSRQIFPIEKTGWTFSPPQEGCLPRAMALILEYDGEASERVVQEFATVDETGIRQTIIARNALRDLSDPRILDGDGIAETAAAQVERQEIQLDQVSLSELATGAPEVIEWAQERGYLSLGDWNLLSTAESGEAINSASAILTENQIFPSNPGAATPDFLILDVFQRGGKSGPQSSGIWDRVSNRITNSARITHPANTAIIQARAVQPKPQIAGQAAPASEIDVESQTVSIVLERNLGDLRLVPGLLAIGSGLIFGALAFILHARTRAARREGIEI